MPSPIRISIALRNWLQKLTFSYYTFCIASLACAILSYLAIKTGGTILAPRVPYYLLGFCLSYGIGMIAYRYRPYLLTTPTPLQKPSISKCRYILTIVISILASSLSCLLYTAWFKGDDYAFMHDSGIAQRMESYWHSYLTWVSRSGELLAHLIGVTPNRWQVYILIPIVVALAPFFLFRLVTPPSFSIATRKGICFYTMVFFLMLIPTYVSAWRIFYCFAAGMNYLLPSVCAFLLLSNYNPTRWYNAPAKNSISEIAGSAFCFALGTFVCWGGEALSLIVLFVLAIWFAYRMTKRQPILLKCWHGLIGCIIGTTLLFAAPALSSRSRIDSSVRTLDISLLSPEQLNDFLSNLTWEKVNMLKGGSSVIVLDGIPLWKHIFFLPYHLERYLECSVWPLAAFFVLTITVLVNSSASKKRILLIFSSLTLFSILSACSYLYSCIPTHMSFTPSTFILLYGISYVYWNSRLRFCNRLIFTVLIAATALCYLIPAGIEGWQYKQYEIARFEEIAHQKAQGKQHIVLPPAYPSPPKDSLGLIMRSDLKENPSVYPNNIAAWAHKVESISQLPIPQE